jgi:hypothetical protein
MKWNLPAAITAITLLAALVIAFHLTTQAQSTAAGHNKHHREFRGSESRSNRFSDFSLQSRRFSPKTESSVRLENSEPAVDVSVITPTWRVSEWRNVWQSCRFVRGGQNMSELLTVRDVATVMKMSEDAVTKIFAKMPGVIDLGRAETRQKR